MRRLGLLLVLSALGAACGDDTGSGGTGATGGGGSPATGGAASGGASEGGGPPAASCTQPGDLGNELGVGEYCTPQGGQCADNDTAQLCLADASQDEWMCTRIGCTAETDCGTGAGCLITDDGSACVPCACDAAGIGCGEGGGGTGGAGGAGGAG